LKHAREDYKRIQDPSGLIPEDEPVFLLRGQDVLASDTIYFWADAAEKAGVDSKMVEAARNHAVAMDIWQAKHFSKVPDMP